MKLHSIGEIPPRARGEIVFKEAIYSKALFNLILFIVFSLLVVIWFRGGYQYGEWDIEPDKALIAAVVSGLLLLLTMSGFRETLTQSNWLLKVSADTFLIKYRSYLNNHFPVGDPVVISISFGEIKWIRKTKEGVRIPHADYLSQTSYSLSTYMDIKLASSDTIFLKDAFAREKRAEPPKNGVSRTKSLHYPVRLIGNDIIRLEWKSSGTSVVPNMKKAVKILGRRLQVEPELRFETDLTGADGEKQTEDLILKLMEIGEKMSAASLVRKKYGYSLTKANRFVEEIMERHS